MANYTRALIYLSEGEPPVGNVDCTQAGTTLLTRTRIPTGSIQFHPLRVFVKVFGAQNIDTPATISIGTNSPNFNNIVASLSIPGVNRTFQVPDVNLAVLNQIANDAEIMINVVTPATGTNPQLRLRGGVEGVEV